MIERRKVRGVGEVCVGVRKRCVVNVPGVKKEEEE